MTLRFVIGIVLASLIAVAARRTRSLAFSGAIAAIVLGTLAVGAAWSWGALLIIYFAASTALSHAGRAEKEVRTASVVAKGGERDAMQVLANGGVFALAALGQIVHPDARWLALGAGSLAASAADTWATEIGTLYGGTPRSILTMRRIAPGTSGGVSLPGLLASALGAVFIAAVAAFAGGRAHATAIVAGGVAGSLVDSLLGATLQVRRWCGTCDRETERDVHDCGTPTRHARGLHGLDNDLVNLLSNVAGGLLAALIAR